MSPYQIKSMQKSSRKDLNLLLYLMKKKQKKLIVSKAVVAWMFQQCSLLSHNYEFNIILIDNESYPTKLKDLEERKEYSRNYL